MAHDERAPPSSYGGMRKVALHKGKARRQTRTNIFKSLTMFSSSFGKSNNSL